MTRQELGEKFEGVTVRERIGDSCNENNVSKIKENPMIRDDFLGEVGEDKRSHDNEVSSPGSKTTFAPLVTTSLDHINR